MRSLQEKFQITLPMPAHKKNDADEKWVSWKKKDTGSHTDSRMPPGMDISDQFCPSPMRISGEGDVSKDVTRASFRDGFTRRTMLGSDDQYTGEHVDHFYGEAVGDDGNAGFVERNNYLDRE